MKFGIFEILQLLGSLAFFIYGMKLMSEGIQRAAGSQLRNILRTMTKNRFLGVFTGFLITALVQSSSATTVMTVSFVNAGLLSLVESAGVMMGANIGTTITGWLISILGFKVKLSAYSIPLFAVGLPMLFMNKGKIKYWGQFILGFAILFLGLSFLKDSVPDIKGNPEVLEFLKNFSQYGFFSRVFFVLIGALVTVVVQSSSAAMAITLTMCSQGWLPFEVATAMILGENIGTTITAEIASLVGNTAAKRSARIHSMFNIIGVAWMIILLPVLLPILSNFLVDYMGLEDPYTSVTDMPIGLSAFHTVFNFTNVLLLVGFVPLLVRMSILTVKDTGDEEDTAQLKYISTASLTPELATIELQKEVADFGSIVKKMSGYFSGYINSEKEKKRIKLLKKIDHYESITDDLEVQITEYITNLANEEITPKTSLKLRSVLNVCNDLERIGDIYFQMSKNYEKGLEEKNTLSVPQIENINKMLLLVDEALIEMMFNLNLAHYDDVSLDKALEIEQRINSYRNDLRDKNLTNLGGKNYNVSSAMVYNNIFTSLERIGDHIINVNESIAGQI